MLLIELGDDDFTEESLLQGFPEVKPLSTSTRVADGKSPRHSYKVGFDASRVAYMKINRALKLLQRAIEKKPKTYAESVVLLRRSDYTVPGATPGEIKLYRSNHRRLIEASDDRLNSSIRENERNFQTSVETRILNTPVYACFKPNANNFKM